jgi:DNA-binding response OmpR family regulator
MSSILLVGHDDTLQFTRAAVLRTLGVETICCHESAALEMQRRNVCDLVVLCHTLARPTANALVNTICAQWPSTRILRVMSRTERLTPIGCAVAVSSADPSTLVQETRKLLPADHSNAASGLA